MEVDLKRLEDDEKNEGKRWAFNHRDLDATSRSLAESEVETEKIKEHNANALFDSTMKSPQVVFEFVDRAFKSVKSIVRICCLKCI